MSDELETKADETAQAPDDAAAATTPGSAGAGAGSGKKPGKPREEEPESFGSILQTVLSALAIAMLIRITTFELFEIDGSSMEATLLHGDRVYVHKFVYGLWLPTMTHSVVTWGSPRLGEIVILNSPADDEDLVKRVVGLPGDLIEVRDQVLYRNGQAVPQRDLGECLPAERMSRGIPDLYDAGCHVYEERLAGHVYRTSRSPESYDSFGPLRIPAGHVFVMGDHRDGSHDSRSSDVGPIPFARVKGRVAFIVTSGSLLQGAPRWNRYFKDVD